MPGLLKIGQTTRSVGDRVAELNSATGVPAPFTVEAWFESPDPQFHETELHKLLAGRRLPNREFFRITIDEAIAAARSVTGRDHVGLVRSHGQGDLQEQGLLPPSASAYRASVFREKTHQFNLGIAYNSGQGTPQDHAQAARWFRKAAEQGHAEAQFYLGYAYAVGNGVPQDYGEAAAWYRSAAEQGHSGAQNNLGLIYRDGIGIQQDYAEAVVWFRRSADQGNAQSQCNLGYACALGQGVRQDYAEAATWYRHAAEQGHTNAQHNLGLAYANGRGVVQDLVQAHMWIDLAASTLTDDQQVLASEREAIAARMTAEQIAQAQQLTRHWEPRLARDNG